MKTNIETRLFNCIIPARGGSRGILKKNITPLNGQPLLTYTIQTAKNCPFIKGVYVSTDDNEIAMIAMLHGTEVIHRPAKLAQHLTPDKPVLTHAIEFIADNSDIIYLRPTCPLRDVNVMQDAVDLFLSNEYCTSLKSVNKIKPIHKNFFKNNLYLQGCNDDFKRLYGAEYFMQPRQLFEQCYEGNSYVDILKPSVFMTKGDACYGDKILFFETPKSIDIDTIDDIKYLQFKINEKPK